MEKFLKEYNNNIPDYMMREIIKEQKAIMTKIKSHESTSEEVYLEQYILDNLDMTVKAMEMWEEVISESFKGGIFYYRTLDEHELK